MNAAIFPQAGHTVIREDNSETLEVSVRREIQIVQCQQIQVEGLQRPVRLKQNIFELPLFDERFSISAQLLLYESSLLLFGFDFCLIIIEPFSFVLQQ